MTLNQQKENKEKEKGFECNRMKATSMQRPFINSGPALTKIRISNTDFFIDGVKREFRDVNDPYNTIPFGKLKYKEGERGYELLFDKLTRNKYEGYLPEGGVPPMTEHIFIPHFKALEQAPSQEVNAASLKKDLQQAPERHRQRARKNHRI